ncbi:hypothetical protein [Leptolyngbya sp. BC1307]|uniref:hypothetical protein n=1 Tax=Leptolyngbya sp. BC1307 TaxID=2029589 RepID=UPI000EFAB093|nr:hypothetical protein [Leptolyngbya sp. BC1307]
MAHTDEAAFNEVIVNALGTIEAAAQSEVLWAPDVFYTPESVTTDGWRPVQNAWQTLVAGIDLIECNLHGRKRVTATLKDFAQAQFLDEKLLSFGQFRKPDSIDPMLNAWAIVNNLRAFLPDAKKAGQSLAQFFGAQLHGLPWMEALNLSTVGALDRLLQPEKS